MKNIKMYKKYPLTVSKKKIHINLKEKSISELIDEITGHFERFKEDGIAYAGDQLDYLVKLEDLKIYLRDMHIKETNQFKKKTIEFMFNAFDARKDKGYNFRQLNALYVIAINLEKKEYLVPIAQKDANIIYSVFFKSPLDDSQSIG